MANISPSLPASRKTGGRSHKVLRTQLRYSLDDIKDHFDQNITAINALVAVSDNLAQKGNNAEADNILRTQILYLESALDYYMHELVTLGITKMFNSDWAKSNKYKYVQLSIGAIAECINHKNSDEWLHKYIDRSYEKKTLINIDQMKEHLELLDIDWSTCLAMAFASKTVDDAEADLKQLYKRRNAIAHAADHDVRTGQQSSITSQEVKQAIADVVNLVIAIHQEATNHT